MADRRFTRAAVLAALALAVIAVVLVATRSEDTYEVTAVVDQAHGLVAGGEVQSAGLKVGEIEEIELGEDGLPRLRLRLDGDYRLREGATANVRAFSVAGVVNRYVAVERGEGADIPEGAVLGRASTDQPVEVDQVLSTLDPATRRDVRGLLAGLDRSTVGRGPQIEETLRNSGEALAETASLLGAVRSDREALRTLVEQTSRVAGAVAEDPASLGGTAEELAGLLRVTAARHGELGAAVERLPEGLRSPRVALARTRDSISNLRALVAAGRPAARELVPAARELQALSAPARPALRAADELVSSAPADLRALRPLLRTADPVLERAGPVLESANPIAEQLRARLPDFFSFFSGWADFTSNFDANGHAARIGLVGSPAPLRVIGPSDSGAGHLAAPFQRTPGVLQGEPWNDYEQTFEAGASR